MSITEYTGPKIGSPGWFTYWNRKTKREIIHELTDLLEELYEVNLELSADACPLNKIKGDEGGHRYCEIQKEIEALYEQFPFLIVAGALRGKL